MGNRAVLAGAGETGERLVTAEQAGQLQAWFDMPAHIHQPDTAVSPELASAPEEALQPAPVPATGIPEAGAASTEVLAREKYAQSTRLWRFAGHVLLNETVETVEPESVLRRLKDELFTRLAEMLQTDLEFRGQLEINDERTYQVVNGKIVTADGVTPIEDLVENGAKASAKEAEDEPKMGIQATRDAVDLEIIRRVQELKPGQGGHFISMDPKTAFAIDPHYFKNLGVIGYREGLVFDQWFYRVSETEYVFGTYSIDESDMDLWREVQADHGATIPEDESPDTWHRNAIEREGVTLEEMRAEAFAMRAEFYAKKGITTKRYSVTDYLELHKDIVDTAFELLYKPMLKSSASGVKDPVIHEFVTSLLAQPEIYNAEALKELTRIQWSDTFDDQAARMVEDRICYGVVERLRTGLSALVSGRKVEVRGLVDAQQGGVQNSTLAAQVARNLGGDVNTGVRARRTYGGCAGEIDMANDALKKKEQKELTATEDLGRENASEDAAEGDSTSGELRCPKCSVKSPKKDVETVDEKGNAIWCCPCCGFYADVCTGEAGFKTKKVHTESAPDESVVKQIFSALGFTTTKLAVDAPKH